ncbi:MAG: hypothetical protein GQ570_09445 [Helicobacteraceae bacterium]|nr:hypothetical protein [Helicobacteraceae bacterium]
MTLDQVFKDLGVQAAVDYGRYQSIKGDKGDFVDFLLSYDAMGAEDGDSSWMNKVSSMNDDLLMSLSGQASSFLGVENSVSDMSQLQNGDYFNTQVFTLKYQLMEAFKQRIETTTPNETVRSIKVAALYDEMNSIKTPSRFSAKN